MANQYKNEVIYSGQTLISLKEDTVTPNTVLTGKTFHDRSGSPQTGSLITHNVYDELDSDSASDALSANQGRILNEKYNALNSNMTRQDVTSLLTNVLSGTSIKVYKTGPIVEVIAHSQGNSVDANGTLIAAKLPNNMIPVGIGITEPSGTCDPGRQTGVKINSLGEIVFMNNTSSRTMYVQGVVMFMI